MLLAILPLVSALVACSGKGSSDLFAPSSGTGPCTTNCGSTAAATGGQGGGASSSSATGGGTAGTGSTTTSTSGGAGGAGTTSAGAATTGGGAGATGGASAGGTAGTGAGGSPTEDAAVPPVEDAQVDAVVVIDSGHPDHGGDVLTGRDACVTTGMEICDGIDNNCSGSTDEGNACRSGCIGASYNGIGYMLCYGQSQERDWSDAAADCRNHDMHLTRVDDALQNAFIRKTSLGVGYSDAIWIGATDLNREGNWIWTDGTQFWEGGVNGRTVGGHFAAWDMNQPNSAEGPEDCAAVWTGIETWHDVNCGVRHAYICQRSAPTP